MLALPTIAVPLRSYVRYFLLNTWNLADYFSVLAWACLVIIVSIALDSLEYDFGAHRYAMLYSFEKLAKFKELINIQQLIYMPAMLFTKVAILMQLNDIFVTQRHSRRWWILRGLIVANSIFFTTLLFVEIFQCVPRKKIWDSSVRGHCLNNSKIFVAIGVINVIDDFLILLSPILWIIKLRMDSRKKLGICVLFATGLLNFNNENIAWSFSSISLWADAELSSGLFVCCLPVLPRLFKGSANKPQKDSGGGSGAPFFRRFREVRQFRQPFVGTTKCDDPTESLNSEDSQTVLLPVSAPEMRSVSVLMGDLEQGFGELRQPPQAQRNSKSQIIRTVSIHQASTSL
ncbi:MAG: hypothetical protein Q9157_002697 [Trypethelium eluteriae]